MFGNDKNNDDLDAFSKALLILQGARGAGAESQIRTSETVNLATRVLLPVVHGLTVAACILGAAGGLWLATGEILRAVLGLRMEPFDFALTWVAVAVIMGAVRELVGFALRQADERLRMTAVMLAWLGLWVGGLAVLQKALADDGEPWRVVVGFAAVVACGLITYNQSRYLLEPYFPMSPWEKGFLGLLRPVLSQGLASQPGTDSSGYIRLLPHRQNGRIQSTSAGEGRELHPDDLDLIAFINEAQGRGLSRRPWLEGRRVRLRPTGHHVTRDRYDTLIEAAARWGFVRPGGEGMASTWLVEPDQAQAILRQELDALGLGR